jgi:hypothetical protein
VNLFALVRLPEVNWEKLGTLCDVMPLALAIALRR